MSTAVAKQSMYSALQTLAPTPTENTGLAKIEKGGGIPYVGFLHPRSPSYADVCNAIPGIAEGQAYYATGESGQYTKLDPFKFHLIDDVFPYWAKRNNSGHAIGVKLDTQPFGSEFKENVDALILVYTPTGVMPATIGFRGARVAAVKSAAKALKEAASAEWGNKSPDHKSSLTVDVPAFRFTTTAILGTAPNKKTGDSYPTAKGLVKPITPAELSLLMKSVNTPAFQEALTRCREVAASRKEALVKMASA